MTQADETKESFESLVAEAHENLEGNLWTSSRILHKMTEELGELTRAVIRDRGDREAEFGDLLFALVSLSKREDLDMLVALRRAVDKHIQFLNDPSESKRTA